MVLKPELLLLDEPTAYLDRLHTRQLMIALEKIHNSGTTILMATHDLDLVYRWADWIFVIDKGRLILEGSPEDVFAQREIMEELQLGVPLVFEMLSEVSEVMGLPNSQQDNSTAYTIFKQLRERILKILQNF